MKKLKKLSRESMKSVFAGVGPDPSKRCFGYPIGSAECFCLSTGGIFECGQCISDPTEKVILAIVNTCEQFSSFPRDNG